MRDSAVLARGGALFSGVVNVPISTVGVGVAHVSFTRRDSPDSAKAPLFVSFGEDIPLMSFEDMLGYLRFFASPSRLAALRTAPLERRATVWAEFLRVTDPISETPHEEMQAYFGGSSRRMPNSEWIVTGMALGRGMVFVSLGSRIRYSSEM